MRIPQTYPADPPPPILAGSPEQQHLDNVLQLWGAAPGSFQGASMFERYPHRQGDLPAQLQEDRPDNQQSLPRPAEDLAANESQSIRQQLMKIKDWRRRATSTGEQLFNGSIDSTTASERLQQKGE